MKKRDYGKLIPVLCSSEKQILEIALENDLFNKYSSLWPGALTMILKKKENKEETIAVRIPNSKVALKVLGTTKIT